MGFCGWQRKFVLRGSRRLPIVTLSTRRTRQRSSMAEHLPCKQGVVGSTPTAGFPAREGGPTRLPPRHLGRTKVCRRRTGWRIWVEGRWPSGQWHQTVNLADLSYGGSNPSLPTGAAVDEGDAGDVGDGRHARGMGQDETAVAPGVSSLGPPDWTPCCGCSSVVELLPSKQDVVGSNPIARSPAPSGWSLPGRCCCSSVVEHFIGNEEVLGSSPSSSFRGIRHL